MGATTSCLIYNEGAECWIYVLFWSIPFHSYSREVEGEGRALILFEGRWMTDESESEREKK